MQPNAFMRNGSAIHESNTNGYQTSYVYHLENPVRFQKEIKVTIEHGHGNHLCNEMSSVAYWYQKEPHLRFGILPRHKRKPVRRVNDGQWVIDKKSQTTLSPPKLNTEMRRMKKQWNSKHRH